MSKHPYEYDDIKQLVPLVQKVWAVYKGEGDEECRYLCVFGALSNIGNVTLLYISPADAILEEVMPEDKDFIRFEYE
jgi:hypothetical protein